MQIADDRIGELASARYRTPKPCAMRYAMAIATSNLSRWIEKRMDNED